MNKLMKWALCLSMIVSLATASLIKASAMNIVEVSPSSAIAREFAFQPCVTEDTKISIDTNFNHFNDYYTFTKNFTQPVSGDDYAYRVELKTNNDGSYRYEDPAKSIMPAISYIYENVGMYDGEVVNARVTLSNIQDTYRLVVEPSSGAYVIDPLFDHCVYIDHAGIGFCAGRCHVEITFFKQDGTLFTNFKGNMTGTDLDSGQGVYNISGVDTVYYKNHTIITSSGNGVQSNSTPANGMYDENGQFLMMVASAKISFDWCSQFSSTASKWSEGRYISFQKAGFLRNLTPSPTKEVDPEKAIVNEVNGKEPLTYTISQYVPYQPIGYAYSAAGNRVVGQDYHYTKFNLIDTLPELASLDINQIKVLNDANENVTDYFTFTLNNQQLVIQAKADIMKNEEFYAHTYLFQLPVVIDETKLPAYTTQGTFVENNVQLIYSQLNVADDLDGGRAKAITEFVYAIDSYHDEGSYITPSKTNITGGNSEVFDYEAKEGYYITKLIVDGREEECAKTKGSYTFGNISSYHTIEVVSQPYFKITTEVINGTITPEINQIEAGENKMIEYKPDENCYLETIEVDQDPVDLSHNEKSYAFENIQGNHQIKVVYTPYHYIETIAVNGHISGNDSIETNNGNKASYHKLVNGSNVVVSYVANPGYYLDHIELSEYQYDVDTKQYKLLSTKTISEYSDLQLVENQYPFNNITKSYQIKVVYRANPVIKITKTIEDDYNLANGTPISIFKITGTDYQGTKRTFYRTISFKDEIKDEQFIHRSLTIEDHSIPAGHYEIVELHTSRYQLKQIKAIANASIIEQKAIVDTLANDSCHVEFINHQTNFKDYSHNDLVVNHIQDSNVGQ